MGAGLETHLYDEQEAPISHEVEVNDVGKFIEAMLRFFTGKGTLYISSYDFGYWADSLANFRSDEKVRLKTSLPEPAFLDNGFTITDDFIYVFLINCLKNIDARSIFNQFLIYQKGGPLLECCGNFENVYVNANVPQRIIKDLIGANVVKSWK
jgi:hypothetical protein